MLSKGQRDDRIRLAAVEHDHDAGDNYDSQASRRVRNSRRETRHLSLDNNGDRENEWDYLIVGAARNLSRSAQNHKNRCPATCYCGKQRAIWPQFRTSKQRARMKNSFTEKYANIRIIGFILFVLASVFCLYKIYELNSSESTNNSPTTYATELKLVSIFQRHGDRGPSDTFPSGDKHGPMLNILWPNGMSNLTQDGRMRQYRIGLELRRHYGHILDFNASHVLAFSSPIYRCQESINETLRGLFDIETTVMQGRRIMASYKAAQGNANKYCFMDDDLVHNETYCAQHKWSSSEIKEKDKLNLPGGSGSPLEYKKIKIDLTTVPTLTYQYLTDCKWRKNNPTLVDKDLFNSKAIAQLKGIKKLSKLVKSRFQLDFNYTALNVWSTLTSELLLTRTNQTIGYTDHYSDWLDVALPEYRKSKVTLYDLWEQVSLLGYRDRIVDTARLIQLGPMLTSLIKSQAAVLNQDLHDSNSSIANKDGQGENDATNHKGTFADDQMYRDKRMVIYSSHDTILQLMMMHLNLIRFEPEDFESRFNKWATTDDFHQLLNGLRMCKFGLSLAFELYETELRHNKKPPPSSTDSNSEKFPFIQANLYNQADGKFKPIEYKRLKFGATCRKMFRSMNQALPRLQVDSMLSKFYPADFPIDKDLSCPFELFKRVTSSFMMQPAELDKLCIN